MKQFYLLTSLLLLFSFFKAQRVYSPQPSVNIPYLENEGEAWVKRVDPDRKIKSVSWKESKKRYNSFYSLDENGFLTEIEHNRQIKIGPFMKNNYEHKKFTYNNKLASKIEFFDKKGRLVRHREFEYFTPYKIRTNRLYEKNKLTVEIKSEYNADSSISKNETYKYKKGNKSLVSRYEYTYYSDKQRKETRLYNKKGKLKQVWKYDCDFKGKPEVKKSNLICRNTSVDNKGYETEVLFNTDQKGQQSKTVNVFYKVNGKTITVRSEFFYIKNGKEYKWYDVHYPDSIEPWYQAHYYDKKGRKTIEWKYEYSNFNSRTVTFRSKEFETFHKGRSMMYRLEKFNEKGLPASCEYIRKRKYPMGKSEWEYSADKVIVVKNYSKKGRLKSQKQCELKYY